MRYLIFRGAHILCARSPRNHTEGNVIEHGQSFPVGWSVADVSGLDKPTAWLGWTRTRKCRFKKCRLKCWANSLGFQNILAPETFRGGAAKTLTCGSGAAI